MSDKHKDKILNNNLWKVMVELSWPAVIAMVLYGLNTVLDAVFVGTFVGERALAGVSFAYPLTQIPMGLGSLIGVGAGSVLSIAIGSNNKFIQERILKNSNYLVAIFSILYSLLAYLFAEPLIKMMGGGGENLLQGANYFRVTALGSIFWLQGLSLNMIIRAEGKMKTAALIMGIGLIVNGIFNYLFMAVLKMGVTGAAWGTNIAMFVYSLVGFIYFRSGRATFTAYPLKIGRDGDISKQILSLGSSSLIMTVMSLIQGVVVLNAISKHGTTQDIAFYGVVYRIYLFILTPIFGLMRSLQPVIGINFGAKKFKRVISSFKIFVVGATVTLLPFWLIIMISPEPILSSMLPNTTFLLSDLFNLRIMMVLLPILPLIFMTMTLYPGINKGKPAALIGIARQLIFYVPVMLIVPGMFGIKWVYWGSTIIDTTIILIALFMVKKEFKLLRLNSRIS